MVGGVEPLRGGHSPPGEPGPDAAARGRGGSPFPHGEARRRPARPGGRSGAARRGRRAGPLPAVVRVRDRRRLRRDPLGRAGLERLRPLRRAGQLGAPDRAGRRAAHPGDAAHRRRPGAARACRRLGGGLRRDPRRDRARPARAGRAPLRGLDRRGLRGGDGDRAGARPGAGPARRDPRLRRRGDRGLAGALGAARPRRPRLRRLPRPARQARRLPGRRRRWRARRSRSPAGGR